jgi:hypothetical protein
MRLSSVSWAFLVSASSLLMACMPAAEPGPEGDDAASQGRAIKGGVEATDYPESALINMKQNGQIVSACSGAVIAPTVVLTAGHCVHGLTGWDVITPYADGQQASSANAIVYDYTEDGDYVNPDMHDIGLIFLDAPIQLAEYPTIAETVSPDGTEIVNIGRIRDGQFSDTDLFKSPAIGIQDATASGFPYDYEATEVIEPGDSGGPDMLLGTHVIVAVNSGAGGGTEVLARTDLLAAWIKEQVAANGGAGDPADPGGDPGGDPADPGGDPGGDPAEEPGEEPGGECNGVTYEGQCDGDVLSWCEGALNTVDCAEHGLSCGFDEANQFYNCL